MYLQPVILCGGSGLRLWPLSTNKIPKQFITLRNGKTLLEDTITRVKNISRESSRLGYIPLEPLLVTSEEHSSMCGPYDKLEEEYSNDTCVAVARACYKIREKYENPIIIVFSSDHYISEDAVFTEDILEGINSVEENNIVLYGMEAYSPETKYGYILEDDNGVLFKEKPTMEEASLLIEKDAKWNSGIFACRLATAMKGLSSSSVDVMNWVVYPREGKCPSFDVCVLQEYHSISLQKCRYWGWSDVGTWDSIIQTKEIQEETGTKTSMRDCNGCTTLVRDNRDLILVGCDDLLVISSESGLLIVNKKVPYNEYIKEIAKKLQM